MNKETRDYPKLIFSLSMSERVQALKEAMLEETRYVSIDQARVVTRIYKENKGDPVHLLRAKALRAALNEIPVRIDAGELVVGNRTPGVRAGVVFPESGLSWIEREIDTLSQRDQDRFQTRPEDIALFRKEILPYWKGNTLEDRVYEEIGEETKAIGRVVKINQKDHAQGHICPNTEKWLRLGPAGIQEEVSRRREQVGDPDRFYEAVIVTLEGAREFMRRYARQARALGGEAERVAQNCERLADNPPASFHQAVQSVWFLFVTLQMESNASSFSPGRMDQYLYPYFWKDLQDGTLSFSLSLEILESLWLKFNQIVYMRNTNSARYFAGFPIGFNVALGGQDRTGTDASNELSFLFLKAQEDIGMPQPNLSVRLHRGSPEDLLRYSARVIGKGSGMPQVFNDDAVIPALMRVGIPVEEARDYAIVGCVELSTQGNNLGWSDAAMFNLVKVLELTLTGGQCLVDNASVGPSSGALPDFKSFAELDTAFAERIDHFLERCIRCCDVVDRLHGEMLPSPFLSSVIDDCIANGKDVTRGGARFNLSGIQAIQPANIADSLAAIKQLVFEEGSVDKKELVRALKANFVGHEVLRQRLLNKAPKYGNDIAWVDELANKWCRYFAERLTNYTNARGGPYHMGLYTVSAHVPMGQNVGATPDGRRARSPLADGGVSAVYGRDMRGPTALLISVARIDSKLASNGTLLNMKFEPQLFGDEDGLQSFVSLLRGFVELKISHVQFNVLNESDLRAAQEEPDRYRNLTVRVAGYTAYFIELARDLQQEIIARTTHAEEE